MKKFSQVFISAYIIAAIFHLFSITAGYQLAEMVTKVLLMPLLMLYVFSESLSKKLLSLVFLALFLSWLGDIFLLKSETEMYFILGLGAFLFAHVAYLFAFRKLVYKTEKRKVGILSVLPFLIYAVVLIAFIFSSLGEMLVPVLAYAVAITAMGIASAMRKGRTNTYSFYLVLSGAISFILSDSGIAINRFHKPFDAAPVFIMLTYIIAQYNIATGCVVHLRQ
ncbi:MAG: lysoplasmalogenase [Chitinophagales bacterium]